MAEQTVPNDRGVNSVPRFCGADWLEPALKRRGKTISPFGRRVADILGQVVQGIYHIEEEALAADWSRDYCVTLKVRGGYLGRVCTWDGNLMTILVVACHDAAVRLDIGPANIGYKLYEEKDTYDALRDRIQQELEEKPKDRDALLYGTELMRPVAEAVRAIRQHVSAEPRSEFQQELYDITHPGDYSSSIELFDEVDGMGHDADEILVMPGLEYTFTPRQHGAGSISARHPTMEEAVTSARRLLAPLTLREEPLERTA